MSDLPLNRLAVLQRQLADGFKWLSFQPDLEAEFRADRMRDLVSRRMALLVTAFVLIAMTPLQDAMFLHPPAGFVPFARLSQFAVMLPLLAIAAAFTAVPRLRPWADIVALLAAFGVSAGVIWQRHIGASFGFHVPSELIAVVLTGSAVLAGLRLAYFAPTVVLIVALSSLSEISTFGANSKSYYVILAQSMLAIIALLGAGMEEYFSRATWLQRKMLEELTLRDPLTGLINARGLHEVYERVFATATREHRALLVGAIDIDHFKAYNDHYGHLAGDECLKRVAHTLSRHGRRGNDVAARTGGEEFVLVWYDVPSEHAIRRLEELREDIEKLAIPHAGTPQGPGIVTISIGAICAVPGPRVPAESLLKIADEQLYLSKRRGRNCVSMQVASESAGTAVATTYRTVRPS